MNSGTIDNRLLKQVFFLVVIILMGLVLFNQLRFFVSAFLGSVTFYVLMRKRMFYWVEKRRWKPALAAWVLMLLSFFVILVPMGLLGNILYSKISYLIAHSAELMNSLKIAAAKLNDKIGYRIIDDNTPGKVGAYLTQLLPKILGTTVNTITQVAALYFILYFMLMNGRRMEEAYYEYMPLKDENTTRLAREMKNLIISNAIGIPLIALTQGAVGLIGYLIIGIDEPWVWFVATSVAAMLPVVGAMLIYGPLTVMLFVQGQTGKGIAMGLWGFILIGLTDSVVRLLVNRRLGDIHPLITIFGVLAGIPLFGFIGLIFGPVLLSLFLLLLRLYSSEFGVKKSRSQS